MKTLDIVRKSIYSPDFYRSLFSEPLSFSLKYFYSLVIALSLALTVVFSFRLVQTVNSFFGNLSPAILNRFPDELVVTIRGGEARTNVTEPYFIQLPKGLEDVVSKSVSVDAQNLLVIDTRSTFTLEKFSSYKTLILLSNDAVAFRGDRSKITIQTLSGITNLRLTKATLSAILEQIEPLAHWIAPLMLFGLFISFMVIWSFKLLYLFFGALLVWGILRLKKIDANYKKAYQIALHAISLGLIFEFFTTAASMRLEIPFLFTIIMLLVAWVNLEPLKEDIAQSSSKGKTSGISKIS